MVQDILVQYSDGMGSPLVLDETPAYVVVFKPPRVHTVPLKGDAGGSGYEKTLLDWCGERFPQVLAVKGRHPWEGGVVHRLDYETQGLVLVAKTQAALHSFSAQQEAGYIIKEYSAFSTKGDSGMLPGFPPALSGVPCIIASGFRSYGPGSKAVRPVQYNSDVPEKTGKFRRRSALDQGRPYVTEIIESPPQLPLLPVLQKEPSVTHSYFRLRIKRGFRHQIRCHLAWIGYPILNDILYGGSPKEAIFLRESCFDTAYVEGMELPVLGLIAHGIRFYDPASGVPRHYTI
jgi:23S rRNA pseudouridine1911/1915/1917 synthase